MKEYIMQETEEQTTFGSVWRRYEPVQELIRCRDCKWGEPTKNAYGEDRIICGNDDTYIDRYITVPADWFCSDGERKTE